MPKRKATEQDIAVRKERLHRVLADYPAKRGVSKAVAAEMEDALVENLSAQMDAARRHAEEGTPRLPEIDEWVYAESPRTVSTDVTRSGKWMTFTSPSYYDEVWGKVKAATEAGDLGYLSKAPNPESVSYRFLRSHLTCVYTYDYQDLDDVRRVLAALRKLAFPRMTLRYKRDADTLQDNYAEGNAIYVSKSGSMDFEDHRL
jgi:hypothetical protein